MINFKPHKTLAFYHFFIFIEGQSIAKEVYNIPECIKNPRALSVYILLHPQTKVTCVHDTSKTLSWISFKLCTHMYLSKERTLILR